MEQLVDRRLATIKTEHEELFGADSPHADLGVVTHDTPLFKRLVLYLQAAPLASAEVVSSAYRRLELNIDDSEIQSRTGYTTSSFQQGGNCTFNKLRNLRYANIESQEETRHHLS
jgi:hypothetical protein